jgi:HEAT repeat protein
MEVQRSGKHAVLPVAALICLLFGSVELSGCGKSQSPLLAGGKSVEHWVSALHDPNTKVREEAVTKLGNVGTADPAAIPALIDALKDKNPLVRCNAIIALGKSGPAAQDAVGPLTELAQRDHDARVRDYAAKGLKHLKNGDAAAAGTGPT